MFSAPYKAKYGTTLDYEIYNYWNSKKHLKLKLKGNQNKHYS